MQFTIKKSIYKTYKHIKLLFYNVLIHLLRKFNKNVNSIVNNIHLRFNWLIKLFIFSFICLFFKSCNSNKDEVLARVGDKYLYKSDIKIDSFENDEDFILRTKIEIVLCLQNNVVTKIFEGYESLIKDTKESLDEKEIKN